MKKTLPILLFFVIAKISNSQNVGIGTNTPTSKLHVVGTVRSTSHITADGNLVVDGYTGLGNISSPLYRLLVSGESRFQGNGTFTGNLVVDNSLTAHSILSETTLRVTDYAAIGGVLDNTYKLRVYDGNARIGGEFHATGNVGIGNTPDAAFKLRVYGGNSRFDGDAVINGDLNVDNVDINNTLTIDGKGSVRSNGSSPLRIGFDSKYVNVFIANNARVSVTANIADFEGDLNDVRVMVSHVTNDGGFLPWPEMIITPMGPDPVTNTVLIWITNKSGENGMLTGTIYLTTIAKN